MSTFLYTRPSDSQLLDLDAGSITVETGTEDAAYPADNIADLQPEKPAKLEQETGAWMVDLGEPLEVAFSAIIHHNIDPGVEVLLEGNDVDNDWASPGFSQDFTIPFVHADLFSVNPWIKLSGEPVDRTFQYWRLTIEGTNSLPISVGEWRLDGAIRDFGIRNISWGSTRTWRRPAIIHETELLVRRMYDLGTTLRTIEVSTLATDVILSDIEEWFRGSHGVVKPFCIVPYKDEADAWMVTFMNPDRPYTRRSRNVNEITIEFIEVARGLYP